METNAAVVLLVLIAFTLLVQTALLVSFALTGKKLLGRVAALEQSLERDVRPALLTVRRVADNAEFISQRLVDGMPELQTALHDANANVRRVSRLVETLETFVLRPLGPLATGLAIFRGVRKGFSAFRRPDPLLTSGRRS